MYKINFYVCRYQALDSISNNKLSLLYVSFFL